MQTRLVTQSLQALCIRLVIKIAVTIQRRWMGWANRAVAIVYGASWHSVRGGEEDAEQCINGCGMRMQSVEAGELAAGVE